MHRFFAPPEKIEDKKVSLDPGETRHLRDVLRLSRGEIVHVFDGVGHEFVCRINEVNKDRSSLEIIEGVDPPSPESSLELALAAAMLKGDKFEFVVQKSVELGVTRLIPLWTVRCDVRSKDSLHRVERWRKISLEASKQAGRATLMRVENPISFTELFTEIASLSSTALLFSEREGADFPNVTAPKTMTAFVGPEGGWDDSEIEAAKTNGVNVVTLGGRILRAETAAIAITAILQHRFGDLN